MLSVKELRALAGAMAARQFADQLGPFALVQRPRDEEVARRALQLGAKRTVTVTREKPADLSTLLAQFDALLVATLPPLGKSELLTVGRLPDCELVVNDPSVSKRHAQLLWSGSEGQAFVEDLRSSNGTLLNGQPLKVRATLKDGDVLCFGDSEFCFLLADTLYDMLRAGVVA